MTPASLFPYQSPNFALSNIPLPNIPVFPFIRSLILICSQDHIIPNTVKSQAKSRINNLHFLFFVIFNFLQQKTTLSDRTNLFYQRCHGIEYRV